MWPILAFLVALATSAASAIVGAPTVPADEGGSTCEISPQPPIDVDPACLPALNPAPGGEGPWQREGYANLAGLNAATCARESACGKAGDPVLLAPPSDATRVDVVLRDATMLRVPGELRMWRTDGVAHVVAFCGELRGQALPESTRLVQVSAHSEPPRLAECDGAQPTTGTIYVRFDGAWEPVERCEAPHDVAQRDPACPRAPMPASPSSPKLAPWA